MPSIINATTTNGVTVQGDNSGSLQLATNSGTTAVTIDTSQNVGVGTTSPTQKLSVTGNISVSSRALAAGFFNSTNVTGMLVDASTADFYTNNAFAMRISSAGYVTMPNQPAFMAYRTAGAVSGTGIYICNTVTYNDGSNYNSSTGRFTAPVAGRYQCNFFVLMQSGNNVDFYIRVNGTQYAGFDIRDNNAVSGNFTLSTSGVLKLSANDIVDPFIGFQGSGSIYGSGLNGFSMYFLG